MIVASNYFFYSNPMRYICNGYELPDTDCKYLTVTSQGDYYIKEVDDTLIVNLGDGIELTKIYDAPIRCVRRYLMTPGRVVTNSYIIYKHCLEPVHIHLIFTDDIQTQLVAPSYDNIIFVLNTREPSLKDVLTSMVAQCPMLSIEFISEIKPFSYEAYIGNLQVIPVGTEFIYNTVHLHRRFRITYEDYITVFINFIKSEFPELDVLTDITKDRTRQEDTLYYELTECKRTHTILNNGEIADDIYSESCIIEFTLSVVDIDSMIDYRNKLWSVNGITRITELTANDMYDDPWTFSIQWMPEQSYKELSFSPNDHAVINYTLKFSAKVNYLIKLRKEFTEVCKYINFTAKYGNI